MIRLLCALALLTCTSQAAARQLGDCRVPPSQLDTKATLILKDFAETDGSLPDRMVVGNSVQVASDGDNQPAGIRALHEAFYRPLEDATYALLPLPIFGLEITRDRHLLYVCGKADTGRDIHELTVYFMKGYHLDPTSLGTIFGNIFNAAEIKVAPVSISAINLSQLNNGFLGIFRRIPLIGELMQIPQIPVAVIQGIAGRLTSDFAGLGVERIVLTEKYIELAVGVDLNNPTRARKIRRIDLIKAQSAGRAAEAARGGVPNMDRIIYDPAQPSPRR